MLAISQLALNLFVWFLMAISHGVLDHAALTFRGDSRTFSGIGLFCEIRGKRATSCTFLSETLNF